MRNVRNILTWKKLHVHVFLISLIVNYFYQSQLGCGAGLPGICCIKCGAKDVVFQDFVSNLNSIQFKIILLIYSTCMLTKRIRFKM